MIFMPLFLGQALAFYRDGQLDLILFLYTLLYGVLYQIYLLYLNDYADEAIDRTNEQYWLSGGSRVLPEGKLRPADLLAGARVALVAMTVLTALLAVFVDRPWLVVGLALSVTLCWAYNLRPLQLSYRGQGEIVQGLGCGVVLPLIGFYMQRGTLQGLPWGALIPLYLIFHAANIVTALPDYRSDKAGGKRTFAVRHGEFQARMAAVSLLLVAHITVVLVSWQMPLSNLAVMLIPSGLVLIVIAKSPVLRQANAADFTVCKRFVAWVTISQAWLLGAWTGALLMAGRS